MFRKNTDHNQPDLFPYNDDDIDRIFAKAKDTEEYYFYKLIFCKIREEIFKKFYSLDMGRPNSSVNCLVAALIIKHRKNWTFEELMFNIEFNLATRMSIGIFDFSEPPFKIATLYNFQRKIIEYEKKNGENLFEKVFDELTKNQMKKLKLKTGIARTDSFMMNSNIKQYSRLQLLLEVVLRFYRIFSDSDKALFCKKFKHYTTQESDKYIYNIKGSDLSHELKNISQLFNWTKLNIDFSNYADREELSNFLRVFKEHFEVTDDDKIKLKDPQDMESGSLQSPDDPDATFRTKRNETYQGYKSGVTETSDPENELNLIFDAVVYPNNIGDPQLLNERLDWLIDKTPDLNEIHYDGGYGSEKNDKKLEKSEIKSVQTAIKGRKSDLEFEVESKQNGNDYNFQVTCPNNYCVNAVKTKKRYKASFDKNLCSKCPLKDKCKAIKLKNSRTFYFTKEYFRKKQRHKSLMNIPPERRKIRPNVEATVKEFTSRLNNHKLRIRGLLKAKMFVISTAIAINFGRIYRYMRNMGKNPDNFIAKLLNFSIWSKISVLKKKSKRFANFIFAF